MTWTSVRSTVSHSGLRTSPPTIQCAKQSFSHNALDIRLHQIPRTELLQLLPSSIDPLMTCFLMGGDHHLILELVRVMRDTKRTLSTTVLPKQVPIVGRRKIQTVSAAWASPPVIAYTPCAARLSGTVASPLIHLHALQTGTQGTGSMHSYRFPPRTQVTPVSLGSQNVDDAVQNPDCRHRSSSRWTATYNGL